MNPTPQPPEPFRSRPLSAGVFFHVVLHQPEIPNNTGNIGRTCVALNSALHLIHPLGFDVSEKACRRAGLDYWPRLAVSEHLDWNDYLNASPDSRRWIFTTKTTRPIWDAELKLGDHFVFGRETTGLPTHILHEHQTQLLTLPMVDGERSLNLATAVCAVLYEAARQEISRGGLFTRNDGRLHGN